MAHRIPVINANFGPKVMAEVNAAIASGDFEVEGDDYLTICDMELHATEGEWHWKDTPTLERPEDEQHALVSGFVTGVIIAHPDTFIEAERVDVIDDAEGNHLAGCLITMRSGRRYKVIVVPEDE